MTDSLSQAVAELARAREAVEMALSASVETPAPDDFATAFGTVANEAAERVRNETSPAGRQARVAQALAGLFGEPNP